MPKRRPLKNLNNQSKYQIQNYWNSRSIIYFIKVLKAIYKIFNPNSNNDKINKIIMLMGLIILVIVINKKDINLCINILVVVLILKPNFKWVIKLINILIFNKVEELLVISNLSMLHLWNNSQKNKCPKLKPPA